MSKPSSSQPSHSPIGIFDSGVGGLSVMLEIEQLLPNEPLLYFADTAYSPYGEQSLETLRHRCSAIVEFFIQKHAKAVVIACNTATVAMASYLRQHYSIPIIAIEPAIKPAAGVTLSGRIGVFATENTLKSQRYQQLKASYANELMVLESSCAGFVTQVEKGELSSNLTKQVVQQHLEPMLNQGVDTLVLGCTHYPFLKDAMIELAQNAQQQLTILETGQAVAQQLQRVLRNRELLINTLDDLKKAPNHQYYCSQMNHFSANSTHQEPLTVANVISSLLQRNLELELALNATSEPKT